MTNSNAQIQPSSQFDKLEASEALLINELINRMVSCKNVSDFYIQATQQLLSSITSEHQKYQYAGMAELDRLLARGAEKATNKAHARRRSS